MDDDSPIRALHRRQFIETYACMLNWWLATFPSTTTTQDFITSLESVRNDMEQECEFINAWHASMKMPLHASVRYTAALRRLQVEPIVYAACAYKDLNAMMMSCDHDLLKLMSPEATLKSDCRAILWDFIHELNHHTLLYVGYEYVAPTTEEIKENIQLHKQSKKAGQPMARSFESLYEELLVHLHIEDVNRDGTDALGMWTRAMQQHDLLDICKRRDMTALRAVPFEHDALSSALLDQSNAKPCERLWQLFDQLNSLAGVSKSVPSNMMAKIESTANRLASEIACGRTSLDSLDLTKIGESVLQGCDMNDVAQLGSQMSSLLPMLSQLQRTMAPGETPP